MFKRVFITVLLNFWFIFASSQDLVKMNYWQDSLSTLMSRISSDVSEAERIENNFTFVKTLVTSLKSEDSFRFGYDKLNLISIINSPDNKFRVFSWNVSLDDGSNLYYGCVQFNSKKLKLIPLLDKTFQISDVDKDVLLPNEWYGAKYYELVSLSSNRYALLGWKGHHAEYTKKVIDILTLDNNDNILFGAKIFSNEPEITRKIFSYSRQVSMYLKFNKAKSMIEFDHITSLYPDMDKNYKYFGPDATYDSYFVKNGKLIFKENIEVSNATNLRDGKYIDPTKQERVLKSGLDK